MSTSTAPGWASALLALLLAGASVRASDFDVVISEVHYHPPGLAPGDESLEFVEVQNLASTQVSLAGWVLEGGIFYSFEPGAAIPPNAFLVVAADAQSLQAAYGIVNVVGNYTGKLSNGGERVTLKNRADRLIDSVDYRDGAPWPGNADGLGTSLEKTNPALSGEAQGSWRSSIYLGGTPGRINSTDTRRTTTTLITEGETWRYKKGTAEPATPLGAWTAVGFADASWASGPSGFGYGDGDDATVFSDMQDNYTTAYIRRKLTLPSLALFERISLSIVYDDAYIAYLNGVEVGRSANAGGTPGTPRAFNVTATATHENTDGVDSIDLSEFPGLLHDGDNTIAIQVINEAASSSDLTMIPTVSAVELETTGIVEPPRDLEINEVLAPSGVDGGFIEIFNEGTRTESLAGYKLVNSPVGEGGYVFAAGTMLAPGAWLSVPSASLPFVLGEGQGWLGLVTGDLRFIDGVQTRSRSPGQSWGRYPDGNGDDCVMTAPTPGAANSVALESRIVINELRYHPPSAASTEEFVELTNRGGQAIDISGWRLDNAVSYTLPASTSLAPGAFLVISGNPAAVAARYGIVGVLGPWTGQLSNAAEKLELKDALGNRADVVHYADDGRWPLSTTTAGPDGFGPSIELVNPGAENNAGSAWVASSGTGTPGAVNSGFVADPPPTVRSVSHSPAMPRSSDTVTVTANVADERSLASVKLFSRPDGNAAFTQTAMLDDGLHGDGDAGDGRYGAALPARANGSIVQFYVEAADGSGHVRRFPADAPSRICLYQVDDRSYPGGLPLYRAILRGSDLADLLSRPVTSDVELDGTFIHGNDVTYNVGVRYRGEHSRNFAVKSFRIQFTSDEAFQGITNLDLNAEDNAIAQLAADFFRRSGQPVMQTTPVAYTLNNDWGGSHGGVYLHVEAEDNDFLGREFPGDDTGNLYRGFDAGGGNQGNLSYKGSDPSSYVPIYLKKSNQELNDYSDIIELTNVFQNTSDADFVSALQGLIDLDEWIRYFAVEAVLNNQDGCIATNVGEDYFIYHRPSDGKWVILPWDQNENFQRAEQGIFRQSVAAIKRLVTHTDLRPIYHESIRALLDGPFREDVMNRQIDAWRFAFPQGSMDLISSFVTARQSTVRALLPAPTSLPFLRGDANGDTTLDISDALHVLFYLFTGNVSPRCLDALDADDSGQIALTDAFYLLNYLFRGGAPPLAPFPGPGLDPTTGDPYECTNN